MRRKKGIQGWIVVKINLEKTYNKIEWDFLEAVLHKIGLEGHLIQLIMKCTSQASLSVLWNGINYIAFNLQEIFNRVIHYRPICLCYVWKS